MHVAGRPPFREHRISTAIYPGFPTDLQAPFSLALVAADGVSTIKENLYEDRFDYAQALQRMGASIHVFDSNTAVFHGPSQLHGTDVEIPDLRAGATLVLAALAADGGQSHRRHRARRARLRGHGRQVGPRRRAHQRIVRLKTRKTSSSSGVVRSSSKPSARISSMVRSVSGYTDGRMNVSHLACLIEQM